MSQTLHDEDFRKTGAGSWIEFACPQCGRAIRVPGRYARRVGLCKSCGERVRVPDAATLVGRASALALVPDLSRPGGTSARWPQHQSAHAAGVVHRCSRCGHLVRARNPWEDLICGVCGADVPGARPQPLEAEVAITQFYFSRGIRLPRPRVSALSRVLSVVGPLLLVSGVGFGVFSSLRKPTDELVATAVSAVWAEQSERLQPRPNPRLMIEEVRIEGGAGSTDELQIVHDAMRTDASGKILGSTHSSAGYPCPPAKAGYQTGTLVITYGGCADFGNGPMEDGTITISPFSFKPNSVGTSAAIDTEAIAEAVRIANEWYR